MPRRFMRNNRRRNFGKGKPKQIQVNSQSQIKKYVSYVPWLMSNALRLKGLVNTEVKNFDILSSTTVSSTGTIAYLSAIATGTDTTDRIGRSIKPLYIHSNGTIARNASATATFLRIIVFQDMENDEATPAVTDVLATATPQSQYNLLISRGRFKMIYDKLLNLDSGNPTRRFTITARIMSHIYFGGTGATTASASKGALFALYISNEATNTPQIDINHRIRFIDN